MGNDTSRTLAGSRSFQALQQELDGCRSVTPERSPASRGLGDITSTSRDYVRSKSSNLDSSFQRKSGMRQATEQEQRWESVRKAEAFCCKFMNEVVSVKNNANINSLSSLMSTSSTRPVSRFEGLDRRRQPESEVLKRVYSAALSLEKDTCLQIEMTKHHLHSQSAAHDTLLEESPMINYLNKLQQRKANDLSTPSPRSRASFTEVEESPHFARNLLGSATPSSSNKNSGTYNLDSHPGHLVSFGGHGQNFFMPDSFNDPSHTRQAPRRAGGPTLSDQHAAVKEKEKSGVQKTGELATHFSFQQKPSPAKDTPEHGHFRESDVIEEEDEDMQSSKGDCRRYRQSGVEESQRDSDQEDLEQLVERTSNHHNQTKHQHQQYVRTQRPEPFGKRAGDQRPGFQEVQTHKYSHNSAQSGNASQEQVQDAAMKYTPSMMPHYHHLLQKARPEEIRLATAGTGKADERMSQADTKISSFKADEEASKKVPSKDDSMGAAYESARRVLVKNIGESYQSKESLSSLGMNSRARENFSSHLDSDNMQRSREGGLAKLMAVHGEQAVGATQSLDYRGGLVRGMGRSEPDKKAQSTGLPMQESMGTLVAAQARPGGVGVSGGMNMGDVERAMEMRRKASKSPVRVQGSGQERESLLQKLAGKIGVSQELSSQKGSARSHLDYSSPSGLVAGMSGPGQQTGYLHRFQRKMGGGVEDKRSGEAEGMRRSGTGVEMIVTGGNKENSGKQRDPILERLAGGVGGKLELTRLPKPSHAGATSSRLAETHVQKQQNSQPQAGGVQEYHSYPLSQMHLQHSQASSSITGLRRTAIQLADKMEGQQLPQQAVTQRDRGGKSPLTERPLNRSGVGGAIETGGAKTRGIFDTILADGNSGGFPTKTTEAPRLTRAAPTMPTASKVGPLRGSNLAAAGLQEQGGRGKGVTSGFFGQGEDFGRAAPAGNTQIGPTSSGLVHSTGPTQLSSTVGQNMSSYASKESLKRTSNEGSSRTGGAGGSQGGFNIKIDLNSLASRFMADLEKGYGT